jgi:hypothetical protein
MDSLASLTRRSPTGMVICVNVHATRQSTTLAKKVHRHRTGMMKVANASAHLLLTAIHVLTQVPIQIGTKTLVRATARPKHATLMVLHQTGIKIPARVSVGQTHCTTIPALTHAAAPHLIGPTMIANVSALWTPAPCRSQIGTVTTANAFVTQL